MSHELRTPLNAIIGYSEMLQEEAEDLGQDDFVPDLQKINAAGKHLLGLINDILDLSKIEAGKMELYLETFDVGDAGPRRRAPSSSRWSRRTRNKLAVDCADDLGTMRADLTKVRQSAVQPAQQRLQVHRARHDHASKPPASSPGVQERDPRGEPGPFRGGAGALPSRGPGECGPAPLPGGAESQPWR